MSILSPGTGESSIYFGNPGTNGQKDGWIKYYHETHATESYRRKLYFRVSGNDRFWIESNAAYLQGANHTSFQVRSGSGNVKAVMQTVQDVEVRIGATSAHPTAFYSNGLEKIKLTTTTNQMLIANGVKMNIGGNSGHTPLHIESENETYGKCAIFGANGWVNHANYHYTDATITLQGRDADNNDKGAGIEFTVRNTGDSNWLHGAITQDRSGNLNFLNGGAGTYVGTQKLRIDSSGTLITGNHSDSALAVHTGTNRGVNITQNGRVYCKTDDHWDLNHVGAGLLIRFRAGNDAGNTQVVVGNITLGTGSVAFNETQSDSRLKKNIEPWTDEVLQHFKTLQPKKFHFNWESDSDTIRTGYIAQDLVGAFPEAYPLCKTDIGESEEVDRHFFNPSGMVKYLMKALQEEIVKREEIEAKYNALEVRISALEGS